MSPSFYFLSLFLFQLYLMSTSAPDEMSVPNTLCDSSLGSVVTSDYVTPLTKRVDEKRPEKKKRRSEMKEETREEEEKIRDERRDQMKKKRQDRRWKTREDEEEETGQKMEDKRRSERRLEERRSKTIVFSSKLPDPRIISNFQNYHYRP